MLSFSKTLSTFVDKQKKNEEYMCIYPKMAQIIGININSECTNEVNKASFLCQDHSQLIYTLKCPFPKCKNFKNTEDIYCIDSKKCISTDCINLIHGITNGPYCQNHTCNQCKMYNDTGKKYCGNCKCSRCDINPKHKYMDVCSEYICKNCKSCTKNGSKYCDNCKCTIKNCRNLRQLNSKRCKDHICSICQSNLKQSKHEASLYCKKCKCSILDCQLYISTYPLLQKYKLCDSHIGIEKCIVNICSNQIIVRFNHHDSLVCDSCSNKGDTCYTCKRIFKFNKKMVVGKCDFSGHKYCVTCLEINEPIVLANNQKVKKSNVLLVKAMITYHRMYSPVEKFIIQIINTYSHLDKEFVRAVVLKENRFTMNDRELIKTKLAMPTELIEPVSNYDPNELSIVMSRLHLLPIDVLFIIISFL